MNILNINTITMPMFTCRVGEFTFHKACKIKTFKGPLRVTVSVFSLYASITPCHVSESFIEYKTEIIAAVFTVSVCLLQKQA